MRDTAIAVADSFSYASLDVNNFVSATRPITTTDGADLVWLFLLFGVVVLLGGMIIYGKYFKPYSVPKAPCDDLEELEHLSQRIERIDDKMAIGFRETHARIDQIFDIMVRAK